MVNTPKAIQLPSAPPKNNAATSTGMTAILNRVRMLGRLLAIALPHPSAPPSAAGFVSWPTVEMIVNPPCNDPTDARDGFQIGKSCLGDAGCRSEMVEQRPFPPRTDTLDLIERGTKRSPWRAAPGGIRWRNGGPRRAAAA